MLGYWVAASALRCPDHGYDTTHEQRVEGLILPAQLAQAVQAVHIFAHCLWMIRQ